MCWLCCDPLPPIPLGPKPLITVGRSDTCDLVLPHKEVSRVHGLFKVRAKSGMIVYEDEGSSNGSYLNGKRTPSSILREGDTLTIGPYEMVLRSNEDMHSRHKKDDTTGSLELTSVARIKPSAAMTGLLHEVPMTEVLQGIEFNKKTGTLSVVGSGRREGQVSVLAGQPLRAHFGDLVGSEAVLAMIQLPEGRFTLTGEVDADEERNMNDSLTGLLLEASRRIDEVDLPESDLDTSDQPLRISSDSFDRPSDEVEAAWGDEEPEEAEPEPEAEASSEDAEDAEVVEEVPEGGPLKGPSVNTTVNNLFDAMEDGGDEGVSE
jgi:pSer/pThr/pTyr-binding forkhead associated (FHA) protein